MSMTHNFNPMQREKTVASPHHDVTPPLVSNSLDPLIDVLQDELADRGISVPGVRPGSAAAFTRWYLEVVQRLETDVAAESGSQPISRREVELLCRCALTAKDLGEAMQLVADFCAALYPRAGELRVRMRSQELALSLDSLRPECSTASSLLDITGLFAFHQLFQWLAGVDLQLQEVRIGTISRDDMLPFLRLFGAPVLAGGDEYALSFPASIDALPVVRSAADFGAFFELYPCAVFGSHLNTLAEQVAATLGASMLKGASVPRQADLARSLGIPLSTFRHRLRSARTSYREIREQCLREAAEHLLRDSDMPVAAVAEQLGFSDSASFRRFFRRVCDSSPTRWRRDVTRVAGRST
ncbi:MAG: helix-turn-helix domain-containing protein [Halioglobus sp.]|nr:helix-turn-helix domain-containing protein [Halioglobus sp.]